MSYIKPESELTMTRVVDLLDDTCVREMYMKAFPKIEQLPYRLLRILSRFPTKDFFAFTMDGKIVAHAFLVVSKACAMLYYFAVDESLRGSGIGSRSLALLKEHYRQPLIVIMKPTDPDSEDIAQRLRRRAFYERAGFSTADMTVTDWSGSFSVFSTAGKPEANTVYRMLKRFTPWDRQLAVTEDNKDE